MDFSSEIAGAIGKRVSIRLRDGDSMKDLLGVLQSENELIKRDGSIATFSPSDIAFFKIVPVFNRLDQAKELQSSRLHIYETASRQLQEISSDIVRIYSCGPTVYRDAHVGNMRTFLLTDLIIRVLALSGQSAITVQNITDVGHMNDNFVADAEGDKVLQEAKKQSLTPIEIARKYEERFHADLAALNITPSHFYPRASEKMSEIIAAITTLIESGNAYIGSDKNVYFSAESFSSYGFISGNKLDSLKPGHRYEFDDDGGKRFHADWALWKVSATRTELVWDSPWGVGFPGWHIECSAMSLELLGDCVDLHVGGIDLRFPHHENERAQTNSIAQKEVVSHWLHGEHLLFEGRKMSKSAGNVVLVEQVLAAGLDPLALRLALLENRYRSQMNLTWDSLKAAGITLERWRSLLSTWGTSDELKLDTQIYTFLMNDLDTPKVLIRLRAIEKDSTIGALEKRAIFLFADDVLGLELNRAPHIVEISKEIQELIDLRADARAMGNWSESDRLRDELLGLGYKVQDNKS
jgi:cysteinyl-tRNA synthetase